MWKIYFLQNQGFRVDTSVVYQDNKSAILLEENERTSSSNRTKHINVRNFYIYDRVDNGEVTAVHCPTDQMTGD